MTANSTQDADSVRDCIQGQADAERFLERLRTECLNPDDLLRAILLAHAWSPERLRGFCRATQKRLERWSGHG